MELFCSDIRRELCQRRWRVRLSIDPRRQERKRNFGIAHECKVWGQFFSLRPGPLHESRRVDVAGDRGKHLQKRIHPRRPRRQGLPQLISPNKVTAAGTLAHRIGKTRKMPARLPHLGIHDDRTIHADHLVLAPLRPDGRVAHHVEPPGVLDVALQLGPQRPVVPEAADAAVDLAAAEYKPPPPAKGDDLLHRLCVFFHAKPSFRSKGHAFRRQSFHSRAAPFRDYLPHPAVTTRLRSIPRREKRGSTPLRRPQRGRIVPPRFARKSGKVWALRHNAFGAAEQRDSAEASPAVKTRANPRDPSPPHRNRSREAQSASFAARIRQG